MDSGFGLESIDFIMCDASLIDNLPRGGGVRSFSP